MMNTEKTWQSKKAVDHYSRVADILLPNRQKILSIIGRVATISSPDAPRILDIGCGHGSESFTHSSCCLFTPEISRIKTLYFFNEL